MITPDMSCTKSIQLSITDLDEAKSFAAKVNEAIVGKQQEIFAADQLESGTDLASNGAYEYSFQNSNFLGMAKLVVGWDMKHVAGENKKFMALNYNNKFGNRHFQDSIEGIQKLPDKGYFGGMFLGGLLSFAGCMGYAYYTEALDVFFFFIVILVVGWLGSKVGSVLGERLYNSRYDDVAEEAMSDAVYISLAEKMTVFNEEVEKILDNALEEDKARAAS